MNKRKLISYILLVLIVPIVVVVGSILFKGRQYAFLSFAVIIIALVPFIIHFENDEKVSTVRMVLISVMVALSVAGRFAFSYVPHFKPVTAFVIIAGIYLGAESGFICGALSAVISNFIFGQGAWTPFQMFAWGIIGFVAGVLSKYLIEHKILLYIYAALSGVLFSLFMDTWTAVYIDGTFVLSRYLTLVAAALPVTAIYAVSNVLFLLLLFKPVGKRIERITTKYGVSMAE